MHRIALTALALTLAATVTADAAPKKSGVHRPAVAAKQVRHKRVARPATPSGQYWQSKQGWPTSWSDGSFSYGGFGGGY